MSARSLRFWLVAVTAMLIVGLIGGLLGSGWRLMPPGTASASSAPPAAETDPYALPPAIPGNQAGNYQMVTSYAAKFACMEPLPPGTFYYGTGALPLVRVASDVLIHNPNVFTVTIFKKAVIALAESLPQATPGQWQKLVIAPDRATRDDCDEITKLLTGNPAATFIGTYGIGVRVEGFVVVAMGPQNVAGANRPAALDVTAEYERSSEVMKKDINYQPWWTWWWWGLPNTWRLGYAYNRVIQVNPSANIDCRSMLYQALHADVTTAGMPANDAAATHIALQNGEQMDPSRPQMIANTAQPALVALIGDCKKFPIAATMYADISYVLVSNKGPTDPDPRTPTASPSVVLAYPWHPGRWYDLPVVMPQNRSIDMDDFMRQWTAQRWVDAAGPGNTAAISQAMVYYFPYWCGWGYWWWWWNTGSCTDIGVGEGESFDVEQVTPSRVFMAWPPIP